MIFGCSGSKKHLDLPKTRGFYVILVKMRLLLAFFLTFSDKVYSIQS